MRTVGGCLLLFRARRRKHHNSFCWLLSTMCCLLFSYLPHCSGFRVASSSTTTSFMRSSMSFGTYHYYHYSERRGPAITRPSAATISTASSSTSSSRLFRRCSLCCMSSSSSSSSSASSSNIQQDTTHQQEKEKETVVPLYRSEGLLSVIKPLEWTSNDVVSYIRGILERDARHRGARPVKVGGGSRRRRRNNNKNKNTVKVGHGGTLDPLATGVLVIGVGKGTKELQGYLSGSKRYKAGAVFGFETTTLDMEGNVTKRAPYDHVTVQDIQKALPQFVGTIQQVPPIYSAIRKDGKKLYQVARTEGASAVDNMEIEPRQVTVHSIKLTGCDLPNFEIEADVGGGTYIRSLIRDIGYKVDSVATTTYLERTQQGPFTLDNGALEKDDWSVDSIYEAIDRTNAIRAKEEEEEETLE